MTSNHQRTIFIPLKDRDPSNPNSIITIPTFHTTIISKPQPTANLLRSPPELQPLPARIRKVNEIPSSKKSARLTVPMAHDCWCTPCRPRPWPERCVGTHTQVRLYVSKIFPYQIFMVGKPSEAVGKLSNETICCVLFSGFSQVRVRVGGFSFCWGLLGRWCFNCFGCEFFYVMIFM